jgi:hypothetical protein
MGAAKLTICGSRIILKYTMVRDSSSVDTVTRPEIEIIFGNARVICRDGVMAGKISYARHGLQGNYTLDGEVGLVPIIKIQY